jgi:diacylglycerol kinase (ATP)
MISTITSVLATLPTYESNICQIVFDDGREEVATKMTMSVIANGKFLGGGFMAAPAASFSDGLLDVLILKDSGSLKMIDGLANLKTGDYTDESDIFYKQAKKVALKSKERDVTVAVDGEPIGILPGTFQVNQYGLNMIL